MRSLVVTVLALVLTAPLGAASGLEGDWVLVEQSYGAGRANLPVAADPDERLVLEVRRAGGEHVARVRAGRRDKAGHAWPAWITDAGALPLEIVERAVVAGDELRASYRVWPSANGDTLLTVVERYRLDGETLVGSLHVSFRRDGEPRGEYVLHRRFERAP